MKPYMAFSRALGSAECAILVFAHTAREAKKVGWGVGAWMITDDFTDFAVRWMKAHPWLEKEMNAELAAQDKAHVIDDPRYCKACEQWGEEIGDDGLCPDCRDGKIDELEYL